jgi:hypothetical protein
MISLPRLNMGSHFTLSLHVETCLGRNSILRKAIVLAGRSLKILCGGTHDLAACHPLPVAHSGLGKTVRFKDPVYVGDSGSKDIQ